MKKPIIYEIAEKRLALRTMVLGQLESLAAFLKQEGAEELSKLFSEGVNPADVNKLLFDVLSARKVADLLAIILCEEGQRIEEKDENALATFIRNNMTVEELGTVLSDFYGSWVGESTSEDAGNFDYKPKRIEDTDWEEVIVSVAGGVPSEIKSARWRVTLDTANAILRYRENLIIDRTNLELKYLKVVVSALGVKDWGIEEIPRADRNRPIAKKKQTDESIESSLVAAGIPITYVKS